MGSREKLFAWGDAYDVEGTQQLFVDAVRENCAFHAAHCEAYGNVLQHMGFSPESLRTPQALAALPALPTVFFKKHEVYSMPRHRALIHATSSGTQGSMSHIAFEASGLWCGLHMVLRVARWRGLLSAGTLYHSGLSAAPGQPYGRNQNRIRRHTVQPGAKPHLCIEIWRKRLRAGHGGRGAGRAAVCARTLSCALHGVSLLHLFYAQPHAGTGRPCAAAGGLADDAGRRVETVLHPACGKGSAV